MQIILPNFSDFAVDRCVKTDFQLQDMFNHFPILTFFSDF